MLLFFLENIFNIYFVNGLSNQIIENMDSLIELKSNCPLDTGRKLNVYKTFRRCWGRFLNVLCTFSLHPVSTGWLLLRSSFWYIYFVSNKVYFNIIIHHPSHTPQPCDINLQLEYSWGDLNIFRRLGGVDY